MTTATDQMLQARRYSRNPDRDAEIIALRREGFALGEIGEAYGITKERVRQVCVRAGVEEVPAQPNAAPPDGYLTMLDAYEQYGPPYYTSLVGFSQAVGASNVRRITYRSNRGRNVAYRAEEVARFILDRFDGVLPELPEGYSTMPQLAQATGRDVGTVRDMLLNAGLPFVRVGYRRRQRAYRTDEAMPVLRGGASATHVIAERSTEEPVNAIEQPVARTMNARLRLASGKIFAAQGSAERRTIHKMFATGMTAAQIAEAFGVGTKVISNRLYVDRGTSKPRKVPAPAAPQPQARPVPEEMPQPRSTGTRTDVPGFTQVAGLYRLCGHKCYASPEAMAAALATSRVAWTRITPDSELLYDIEQAESFVRVVARGLRNRGQSRVRV